MNAIFTTLKELTSTVKIVRTVSNSHGKWSYTIPCRGGSHSSHLVGTAWQHPVGSNVTPASVMAQEYRE